MTAHTTNPRLRSLFKCPNIKCDTKCILSLIKHSCWSAIILGGIMLGLGLVLRSSLINNSSSTVTSSGLLFILIGIFIICMGPFAAIYDLVSKSKSDRRRELESGRGADSASPESAPPSYNQVMTGIKTPSATYSMRFSELSAKELSNSIPPPPSYEEVSKEIQYQNPNPNSILQSDTRRMTAP